MPRALPTPWVYAGIGVLSGLFSALAGVGGGSVIVPLLVLSAGFASKPATATSLAAIVLTALFGASTFALLGEVDWSLAALVGLPAMAGAAAGVALQRRIASRALTALFALFLIAIAVRLLLE